ncbi:MULTISPECIES: acyl carrier protein [Rhodococcus]|jgi:hypothetical protein|uniref:Possible non-ribosomal peptide synthetase n=3 Tax=Rhodococcus TaxID=1827 RepID=Q0RYE2_RHOJR|nr:MULTISPECIES: phosphopantetheine-binding protein [Rhodococcus]ABG99694.1 possible non-ribosomal peptide synthetase [Rhodococcus jostii RHA1]EID76349.1 non-ribosomal peptide synthetase [Rhodococcus opacus RKJ300 = JCM 13270]EJJ02255.1 phosphopantetheine attachment site family protein [Rhodococcus sp. JVH1]PQP14304.1 peptide synthetase [Rhodococcus opacus]QQZ18922.1 peptide synthetase [Rhodococcus sp. 21391]
MEAVSIAALWSRLLDGAPVRPDDDFFFDLEGNSLLAASIVSELSLSTGLPVELRDLYLAPTPREFAGYLDHLNRRLGEYRTNLAAGFDLGVIADALAELGASAADALLPEEVTLAYGDGDGSRVALLRQARGNGACTRLPMHGGDVLIRRGGTVLRFDCDSDPAGVRILVTDHPTGSSDAVTGH